MGFATDVANGIAAVADEWGWSHHVVNDEAEEAATDVVVAVGNVSIFPDLVRRAHAARRILWHGEILPRPTDESGGRIHELLPTGRVLDVAGGALPFLRRSPAFVRWREQAAIVREPQANLRELRRHAGAFDRVVIDSRDRAAGAIAAGLTVEVVPYGYHEVYAGALRQGGERPIKAIWMAHLVGRIGRRQRLMADVKAELAKMQIDLARFPTGTYGSVRNGILGQSRIVIDIHRLPGNHPGFRFIVATAAGAALVTEPLADPWPLVPGVHYVEATAAEMAEAVRSLLDDESRRRRMVEAAQQLISTELHMRTILPPVLGTSP